MWYLNTLKEEKSSKILKKLEKEQNEGTANSDWGRAKSGRACIKRRL